MSLLNIMMDLKKCCNHPYLFPVAAMVNAKSRDLLQCLMLWKARKGAVSEHRGRAKPEVRDLVARAGWDLERYRSWIWAFGF